MTLPSYERNDTFKSTVTFYSGSTAIDPSGNLAFIKVFNPDGTLYIHDSGIRTSTGAYYYYISTASVQDLGIYRIRWYGSFYQDSIFGYMPRVDESAVIITVVD